MSRVALPGAGSCSFAVVSRLALALAVLATAAGCGSGGRPDLVVSAAASLRSAFGAYGRQFPAATVRTSFGGSDQLAAQIRQGVRPDVFASANTSLPNALFAERLVSKPTVFAANRLVLAVPAGSSKVRSVADAEKPGVAVAVGTPSVPIGAYTRTVLARLPGGAGTRILANVRSEEPDVTGLVGKLTQGAVDAGFVYVTDVTASGGRLHAIALPPSAQPTVAYAAAVVRGSRHPGQARRFIAGLLAGAGARQLRAAGFLPPPR